MMDRSMQNLRKRLQSIKVRDAVLCLGLLWLLRTIYGRTYTEKKHKFEELGEDNVENQWDNIETVLVASRHHRVPLLLFDIDILPEIFVERESSWNDKLHRCKVVCKHHPEEKNVITFAALAWKFQKSKDEFMDALTDLGFVVSLSEVVDPRIPKDGSELAMTPSYLWMARNDHIIHITFLHERGEEIKYLWVAPISDREWKRTVRTLAPMLSDGWHSLDAVGAKFPRYAQAYDLSHRFTGLPVHLDGHRISVPYHIKSFLNEYRHSRFIECGRPGALERRSDTIVQQESDLHRSRLAITMLTGIKKAFEMARKPFWITGGTLLGWYRQCALISHDSELDIAMWTRDLDEKVISDMEYRNFTAKFDVNAARAGGDAYFLNKKGNRVNLLLFDQEGDITRNIRTRTEDGQKFLLTYPTFQLCWSELVGMKLRVPCDSLEYLESYFGDGWRTPNLEWVWHINAANAAEIR